MSLLLFFPSTCVFREAAVHVQLCQWFSCRCRSSRAFLNALQAKDVFATNRCVDGKSLFFKDVGVPGRKHCTQSRTWKICGGCVGSAACHVSPMSHSRFQPPNWVHNFTIETSRNQLNSILLSRMGERAKSVGKESNSARGVFGAGLANRPDIPLQRGGSQGFSLKLLPMDVVDAEGLDLEPVGEDGTCGKEQWGMFSNDMKERDGSEHKMMTRTLFTWKTSWAMQSAHEWNVTRSTRKMCVCARPVRCTVHTSRRVQGSCHCLDAKSRKKRQLQINNWGFSVVGSL